MGMRTYFFLAMYSLFCIRFKFIIAKPLVGQRVRQVQDREFPFTVSVKRRNDGSLRPEHDHSCTGSVVSVKDVMTTSHGLANTYTHSFEILVGSTDIRIGRKFYPAWWINYMQWIMSMHMPDLYEANDIAVIRLTESVPNEIVAVIFLPLSYDALYGQNITVVGWGDTSTGHSCRYLRTGILKIMTESECETRLNTLTNQNAYIPTNVICSTAYPLILSTPGDSGAPVLYMDLLVAINLGAAPNTIPGIHPQKVNFHLAITNFMDFITDILETN